MIKVFLVEDEVIIRESVKNSIDWEKEGYEFAGSITNSGFDFATFGNVTVNVTYTVGDATYKLYSGAAGEDSFPLDIGSADPIGGLSQNSGTFAVTITDSDGIDVTSSFNTSGLSASFSKE